MSKSIVKNVERKSEGFIKVEALTLETPKMNGEGTFEQVREIARQNDSVFILPIDLKEETMLFVRQHRAGAIDRESTIVAEPIAGRLDKGITPLHTAIAEAEEEAGLEIIPEFVRELGTALSSPGGSTENCHLFLAECDLSGVSERSFHGLEHEGEDIEAIKIDIMSPEIDSMQMSLQLKTLILEARLAYISSLVNGKITDKQ